jgi:hypothetical protein
MTVRHQTRELAGGPFGPMARVFTQAFVDSFSKPSERTLDPRTLRALFRFVRVFGLRLWATSAQRPTADAVLKALLDLGSEEDCDSILVMVGRHLREFSTTRDQPQVEGALTEAQWHTVFAASEPAAFAEYLGQLDDAPTFARAAAGALGIDERRRSNSFEVEDAKVPVLIQAVTGFSRFPWTDVRTNSLSLFVRFMSAHLDKVFVTARDANVIAAWLVTWLHLEPYRPSLEEIPEPLLRTCVTPAIAEQILNRPATEIRELETAATGLVRVAASLQPDLYAARLKLAWRKLKKFNSIEQRTRDLVARSGVQITAHLGAELAYEIAVIWLEAEDLKETRRPARQLLFAWKIPFDILPDRLEAQATAHVTLMRAWAHPGGLAGVEGSAWTQRLASFARENPEGWAEMLPLVLTYPESVQPLVQATSLIAAEKSESVRRILQTFTAAHEEPSLRDRAEGLLMLLNPDAEHRDFTRDLLVTLVKFVEGTTAHPHPLELPSSTWLGSRDLAGRLRPGVDAAASRFSRNLPSQLGEDEEPLTRELLLDLVREFERVELITGALGKKQSRSSIVVQHRQFPKHEEAPFGCDVAFHLSVELPGAIVFDSVEFVQVKKPSRGKKGDQDIFRQRWQIDVIPQLDNLINLSQTSVYWLLDPDGQVHVVPARLIRGVIRAEGKLTQSSAGIDYAHIRSMRCSLYQFLVDLFTGAWLGTSDERALAAAAGKDAFRRPRHLFDIKVHADVGQRR